MRGKYLRRERWLAGGLVVVLMFGPACSTMSDGERKTWGTIGGALLGAAAGAAVGGSDHRAEGAIIGAVAGAGIGYLLASEFGADATPEERARPEFKQAKQAFDKGKQAQESGENDVALQEYEKAQELAPEQPEPYVNQGYVYLDEEERDLAEASFRKALAVDPDNEEAKAGLEAMGLSA